MSPMVNLLNHIMWNNSMAANGAANIGAVIIPDRTMTRMGQLRLRFRHCSVLQAMIGKPIAKIIDDAKKNIANSIGDVY